MIQQASLVGALFGFIVFGIICYLVERFIPMSDIFKTIFRIVVVLAAIYWLLALFGFVSPPSNLRLR